MRPVLRLFRAHPYLTSAFALALAVTVFFAARSIMFAVYWNDPRHRDQPIAGWMTPGYVAHSWQVPPEVIREALGEFAPERGDRRPLERIARDAGVPLQSLIEQVAAAVKAHEGPGE